METVNLYEEVEKARKADPSKMTEEQRFQSRIYLRAYRNRVAAKANPFMTDYSDAQVILDRIDRDIQRLTI